MHNSIEHLREIYRSIYSDLPTNEIVDTPRGISIQREKHTLHLAYHETFTNDLLEIQPNRFKVIIGYTEKGSSPRITTQFSYNNLTLELSLVLLANNGLRFEFYCYAGDDFDYCLSEEVIKEEDQEAFHDFSEHVKELSKKHAPFRLDLLFNSKK